MNYKTVTDVTINVVTVDITKSQAMKLKRIELGQKNKSKLKELCYSATLVKWKVFTMY